MSFSAVLLVSLAAAVVLVVGGGLMMYMANLVRNAYELKVQISADVDERIKAISDDVEKRSKWIKRDLIEELEKIKAGLLQANARNIQEMTEPMVKRIEALEAVLKKDRTDWSTAVDETRQSGTQIEGKITQLRRDLRRVEDKLGLEPSSASGTIPPKPGTADAPSGQPGTAATPAQQQAKPPTNGPVEVSAVLPSL